MASTHDSDGPDERHGRGQYVTRKDVRVALIAVGLILLALYPVWLSMRREAQKTICKGNLSAMYKAIQSYAQFNDSLTPPLYVEAEPGVPYVDPKGRVITWATLLQDHMSARHSFKCPSASPEEITRCQHSSDGSKTIELTYGMVAGMGARSLENMNNDIGTVLFAESSNFGASETYDPNPFRGSDGKPIPNDGFLIGYDNSNSEPDDSSRVMTRLAFPKSSIGPFGEDSEGRHDVGIYAISAAGGLTKLRPSSAMIERDKKKIIGLWSNR